MLALIRGRTATRGARSGQMPGEEFKRAVLCHLVIRLAEAAAFIAPEAMSGALVNEAVDLRLRCPDRVNVGHWNRGIGLTKMHLHRAIRLFILGSGDASTVPARCPGE